VESSGRVGGLAEGVLGGLEVGVRSSRWIFLIAAGLAVLSGLDLAERLVASDDPLDQHIAERIVGVRRDLLVCEPVCGLLGVDASGMSLPDVPQQVPPVLPWLTTCCLAQ
jgi:hypothetical protein